jgi:hypothetical protein
VDELDLALVLAIPPLARVGLQAVDDHVDRPLGLLEWVVGVAYLRWRRYLALIAEVLRLGVITSPVLAAIVVAAATLIIMAVVVVAT